MIILQDGKQQKNFQTNKKNLPERLQEYYRNPFEDEKNKK